MDQKTLNQSFHGAVELNKKCPVCGDKYLYLVNFRDSIIYVHPYDFHCRRAKS